MGWFQLAAGGRSDEQSGAMTGTTGKPLLVMLPGLDGTGRLFAPLEGALRPGVAVQSVSYPRDEPLSYDELESWVASRLPARDPFIVLGESFSGPVAIRIAAKRPPGLLGVVLVASFVRSPIPVSWAKPLVVPAMFRWAATEPLLRGFLVGSDAPRELVRDVADTIRSVSANVLASRVREVLSVDARAALRACAVPILYLTATRDRLVRRNVARSIQDESNNVRVEVVDGPHLVLQRAPGPCARAIRGFMSECSA